MQRLSATDSTFVYFETRSMLLHNTAVLLFDPDSVPGGYSFDRVRTLMASRVLGIPAYRRRLVQVPLDLGRPVWTDDPDFDLDAHLHRRGLPSPGSLAELAHFVADVSGRPLDRSRPLWETWIVEGLENGQIAMVSKAHHAAMDGVTGADVLSNLLDLECKDPDTEPSPDEAEPMQPLPGNARLLLDAAQGATVWPVDAAKGVAGAAVGAAGIARRLLMRTSDIPAIPLTAPNTPFNAALTPHRTIGFGQVELDDIKQIRKAYGVTVNDVVLAGCTAGLRRWLQEFAPEEPSWLLACLPVSVHDSTTDIESGNKVSAMFVRLPVGEDDPVEQLLAIHAGDGRRQGRARCAGRQDDHGARGVRPSAAAQPGQPALLACSRSPTGIDRSTTW